MPTQFRVESIEWERVNLTFDLSLEWTPRGEQQWEPVEPAATPAGTGAVPAPGADVDVDVVALEDVDEGPGGAEGPDDEDAGGDAVVVASPETLDTIGAEPADDVLPHVQTIFIRDTLQFHPVAWTPLGGGRYRVRINISNFANRSFFPRGTWKFFAQLDTGAEAGATWDLSRLDELDSLTRAFLFAGNHQVYTVSFGLTEDDIDPLFAVRAYHFVRKSGRGKRSPNPLRLARRAAKSLTSKKRRQQIAQAIYDRAGREAAAERNRQVAAGAPVRPRILFASEMRTGLEGNLLAVRDRMVARGLDEHFDLRYSFRTARTSDRSNYIELLKELGSADVILIDDYFPPFEKLKLNGHARIIQVWHAGSGFKNVGFSRFGKFGSPGLTNAHRKYTYAITASHDLKPVYAEVFGIEPEAVIPTGLPRIDTFLDPASQELARAAAYAAYPSLEGKRVIMFAPTFRGRGAGQATYNYDQIDFEALYDACGEDTVVAFRMHHFIHEPVPIPEHMRDRFVDVSEYRDGNGLLLVTDLLITDYSSIIFEFSLLERPMLFFAYDEQVYSAVRGFHRPYVETAPGKVCRTFDELVTAIRTQDYELERAAAFRAENFDVIDTGSSDRVIDWLILGDPPESAVAMELDPGAQITDTHALSTQGVDPTQEVSAQ